MQAATEENERKNKHQIVVVVGGVGACETLRSVTDAASSSLIILSPWQPRYTAATAAADAVAASYRKTDKRSRRTATDYARWTYTFARNWNILFIDKTYVPSDSSLYTQRITQGFLLWWAMQIGDLHIFLQRSKTIKPDPSPPVTFPTKIQQSGLSSTILICWSYLKIEIVRGFCLSQWIFNFISPFFSNQKLEDNNSDTTKNDDNRETESDLQFTEFSKYFIANFIGSARWPKVMCLPDVVHLPTRVARKHDKYGFLIHYIKYNYPAPGSGPGYCFRAISLLVSLSATLWENGWTDLHEIFREGVEWLNFGSIRVNGSASRRLICYHRP